MGFLSFLDSRGVLKNILLPFSFVPFCIFLYFEIFLLFFLDYIFINSRLGFIHFAQLLCHSDKKGNNLVEKGDRVVNNTQEVHPQTHQLSYNQDIQIADEIEYDETAVKH